MSPVMKEGSFQVHPKRGERDLQAQKARKGSGSDEVFCKF